MLTELKQKNRLVLINNNSPRINFKPILFLDRDGVIINDSGYIGIKNLVKLREGIKELIRIASPFYNISIITNQSGIERGYFGWEDYKSVTNEMMRKLGKSANNISSVIACGSIESSYDNWRKPSSGMIEYELKKTKSNPSECIIIGDKESDMESGNKIGIKKKILLKTKTDSEKVLSNKKYYQASENYFKSFNILDVINCLNDQFI